MMALSQETKCVHCGMCEKKCPAINESVVHTFRPLVYAAWTKDELQRIDCTSGEQHEIVCV